MNKATFKYLMKKEPRWNRGFRFYWLQWLMGFTEIFDGVLIIISLGFFKPSLSFKIAWLIGKLDD